MQGFIRLPFEQSSLKKKDLAMLVDEITTTAYWVDPLGRIRSNDGGWQSQCKNDNEYHGIKQYQTVIMQYVRSWLTEKGFYMKNYALTCTGWFNMNLKDQGNLPHIHCQNHYADGLNRMDVNRPGAYTNDFYNKEDDVMQSIFSGTFYIKVPDSEKKSLYFMNPYPLYKFFNEDFIEYVEVEIGDTILFSPNVYHGVVANQTTEPRITYSFNIGIARPVNTPVDYTPGGINDNPLNVFNNK